MVEHARIADAQLQSQVHSGKIVLAGNKALKIYGLLSCPSGKRMLRRNRVFFASKNEATKKGYRPCGSCLRSEYLMWKVGSRQ